jgi:hypothetical protein
MPSALIDLDEQGQSFLVRYGDFFTLVPTELTNGARLALAVMATVGACKEPGRPIPAYSGALLHPDEAQEFSECRLLVTGANVAALMATGFSWTEEAACAAAEYPVAPGAVAWIRELVKLLHAAQVHSLQQLLDSGRRGNPGRTWEERACARQEWLQQTLTLWGGAVEWQDSRS